MPSSDLLGLLSLGAGLHVEKAFSALRSVLWPSQRVSCGCPATSGQVGKSVSFKGKEIGNQSAVVNQLYHQ